MNGRLLAQSQEPTNDLRCLKCGGQHHPVECLKGDPMTENKRELKPDTIKESLITEAKALIESHPSKDCVFFAKSVLDYIDPRPAQTLDELLKPLVEVYELNKDYFPCNSAPLTQPFRDTWIAIKTVVKALEGQ